MPEGSHDWSDGECVADLVDCFEPRSDIRDVPGSREAEDIVKKLLGGLDSVVGNKKPQEVDVSGPELKFFGVESAASPRSCLQELTDNVEVFSRYCCCTTAQCRQRRSSGSRNLPSSRTSSGCRRPQR